MIWEEHTYLMVDWDFVTEEYNTSMVREEAFKYEGNPLLRLEDPALPLDRRALGVDFRLVTREGATYRLWYQARVGAKRGRRNGTLLRYAESTDGVDFRPVRVGQVRHAGSKDSNLVDLRVPEQPDATVSGLLHDPLDREYPYKCAYHRPGKPVDLEPGLLARWPALKKRQCTFVWGLGRSRDGLVWEPPKNEHDLICTDPEGVRLHRAMDGGLVLSNQMRISMTEIGGRNVKGWITHDLAAAHRIPDFLFTLPEHMCRVHSTDYPNGRAWDRTKWVQPHVGLVCARKGPTILGLHGYLYGATGAETFAQVADIGLACSATGIGFQQVWPFRPFIPRGPRGAWDFGMTAQGHILDADDETRFYYTGGNVGNLCTTYLPGLAYIPRDRYGYRIIYGHRDVERRPRRGSITLKPCRLPERPKFTINVSHVTRTRMVRLELADKRGRVIPGYSFEDCVPITREGLRRPVRWKPRRTGRELAGRNVVIRAELVSPNCGAVYHDSPRLYAIYTA